MMSHFNHSFNKEEPIMLVLSRKAGESIYVGDDIVSIVLNIRYRQIQIGIEAPESIGILRDDAKKKNVTG
jgi:carbon storage regulator